MKVPENTKLIELRTSTIWIDENGILCSLSKKVPVQTLEETKEVMQKLREIFGEEKFCVLIDVTHSAPTSSESRKFAGAELAKMIKAIAMISNSPVGKMVANLFFSLFPQSYPAKMFDNEKDAKEWLKQYL